MPGIKMKATIAGMVMIAGYGIISSTISIEAHAAACPALPDVAWWRTSHAKIVNYVDKRYNGEWDPYIKKWLRYRTQMSDIFDREGTAIVKSRGIRLKGDILQRHILDVDQRIRVTECLKQKHGGRMAFNNPSEIDDKTGAGSATGFAGIFQAAKRQALALGGIGANKRETVKASYSVAKSSDSLVTTKKEARTANVSEVTGKSLDVEISAKCDAGTPVFQVTNLGDKWPRLAAINIYRTNNKAMVTKRRMWLDNSQQATFRMRKRGQPLAGEVGMWIDPSWHKRGFKYDSKIICSS